MKKIFFYNLSTFVVHLYNLWLKQFIQKISYYINPQFFNDASNTGCPKKHGNSVTNSISSLLWFSIVIPNSKSHNIIMSARVYLMKRVKDCKDVFIMSPQDEHVKTDNFTLYTVIFLLKTVCSQNINKQKVNIADEILTDYSFLSRYHNTKSRSYLKRRYRIRHWIPMFIGTPCI